jgi:hypothetical protein
MSSPKFFFFETLCSTRIDCGAVPDEPGTALVSILCEVAFVRVVLLDTLRFASELETPQEPSGLSHEHCTDTTALTTVFLAFQKKFQKKRTLDEAH